AESRPPTKPERHWLESLAEKVPELVWHSGGCERCAPTGYFERTGVVEVLPVNDRFYDLILTGEDEHALREHLRAAGFRLLLRDGLDKAAQGITDFSELTRIGVQSDLDRAQRR
nr:type II/IV secretion system protein [Verrucomicrobiota bacterium]